MDDLDRTPPEPSDSWKGGTISRSLYSEMRRIAQGVLARYPAGRAAHPSSLIHEAIYKLRRYGPARWASQRHFLNVAKRAMEQVLLDRMRSLKSVQLVRLENASCVCEKDKFIDEMLTFEEAIVELERLDPRIRSIVVCKAVYRRTDAETADELGLSTRSVQRKWRFARAYIGTKLDS